MAKKSYVNAVLEAVIGEMRANPDMVYFYEEKRTAVLPNGVVLDPAKEFGDVRTSGQGWPIDENWIVGAAIGAAAAGSKAIARLPMMTNFYSLEFIFNQAGKLRSMTGGQASMPLVLWLDGAGRGKSIAAQHADAGLETTYSQLPGLKVVVPSNAYDAKGLMISAIRDADPIVFVDYGEVRSGAQPDVPDEPYEIELGKAVVRDEGRHITIVAWAPATLQVAKAVPILAKAGISAEFIDLRSMKPMDADTVIGSVRKTGHLLVVEHGHYTAGFGAHVIAEVAQVLRGPKFGRIAFPDVPCPGAPAMVNYLRPDTDNVVDAAMQLVRG